MTGQAAALATFTFMPDPSSGGCYTLGTVINGVYRYLLPTISPDLPGDALLVVAQPGHNSSMYWQVQNNSDGTYSFVAVGIPSRPCMNRRSDDHAGRVQAISCTTGDPNLGRFYLPSATSTPATLVEKSLSRKAVFTDEPLTSTGQTTLTSDSKGQFAPVNLSYNAEFGNIPQVLIECIAGGCGLGDPMHVSNVTNTGFTLTVDGQAVSGDGSPISLTIYWTASGVVLQQGSATANYIVLTVVYAPPGTNGGKSSSSVTYTSTSIAGTTVSSDQTFKDEQSVSVDVSSVAGGAGGGFDVANSATNSQSIQIKNSASHSLSQTGPSTQDGINHDLDEIWLLLKPTISVGVSSFMTTWSLSAADKNSKLQYVYVGWLNGDQAMPPPVLTALQNAGITPQDYPVIMARDPFATGSSLDPNRFLPYGIPYAYEPPFAPTDPVPLQTVSLYTDQVTTTGVSTEDSYGVQMSATGGGNFLELFSAKITAKGTWTWTSKSTNMSSLDTSSAATAVIGGPAYGYTGGTSLQLYYDTVYNTFAFAVMSADSAKKKKAAAAK